MHRIDGPGSLSGHWSDGNPFTTPRTDGTIATADWFEAVQEEVAAVIEATGRTLSKPNNTQLLAAIKDLIAGGPRKRLVYAAAIPGLTSLEVIGSQAPTLMGTPSFVTNIRGPWLQFDTITPASVPEDIGVRGPFNVFQRRWNPDVAFHVDINTVVQCRLWFGLFSADPLSMTDPDTISCVGFRLVSGVDGGGTWRTVSSNGTGSTVKNTNAAVAINNDYELRIRHLGNGRFEFLVNGVLVNTHAAADGDLVPAAATNLGPVAALQHHQDDGQNKALRFGWWTT